MGRVIRYVSQEKKTMDETGRRYLSGINCTPELAQKSSRPKRKSRLRKRTKSLKNWQSGSSQAVRCWWPHTLIRSTCTPT